MAAGLGLLVSFCFRLVSENGIRSSGLIGNIRIFVARQFLVLNGFGLSTGDTLACEPSKIKLHTGS